MVCLAKYFNKEVVGNVEAKLILIISCPHTGAEDHKDAAAAAQADQTPEGGAGGDLQLASHYAHSFVLDDSGYFKMQQAQRWQSVKQPSSPSTAPLSPPQPDQRLSFLLTWKSWATALIWPTGPRTSSGSSRSGSGISSGGSSSDAAHAERRTVYLRIASAEQLSAAEAVIAAMYGVPDAISSLEQQQVVHALVIADMIGAEAAGQQALQALQAAKPEQGLSAAALGALAGLPVWPACLVQLLPSIIQHAPCCRDNMADMAAVAAADAGGKIQQVLVAALGDLQAAWSDAQLKVLLLGLPLPAMQLLLSSDQLRVPSEDTVLYIAKQYVQAQTDGAAKEAFKAVLVQLVRAPHLSLFALQCATLPADSSQYFLGCYAQQLRDRSLLPLKVTASAEELGATLQTVKDVPDSWQRGPRQILSLGDGVRLEWRLPMEQLTQSCRDSFTQQEQLFIYSPSSPPLGEVEWCMMVKCYQQKGGTVVGLYAGPRGPTVPASIYYKFDLIDFAVQPLMSGLQVDGQQPLHQPEPILGLFKLLQPAAHGGWRLGCSSLGSCRPANSRRDVPGAVHAQRALTRMFN
uniref:BACK domain-containing protein n=1 Tax=Tetradesmus obliquus TaxID=3088 RepID=A0A383W0B1_TETOB|eukprot:jgi/Sobl393_1/7030/SZX70532.1